MMKTVETLEGRLKMKHSQFGRPAQLATNAPHPKDNSRTRTGPLAGVEGGESKVNLDRGTEVGRQIA